MTVTVFIKGEPAAYQEEIPAPDFPQACRYLRKHGFMTSDEHGEMWFPPSMIEMVRPKYNG